MLTTQGPKLFEFNVRFGDPECQVLMLRMMSRHRAGVPRRLRRAAEEFRSALASGLRAHRGDGGEGLSRRLPEGHAHRGLDDAAKVETVEIFHAGTVEKDGAILANGGRVLNVCALGKTVTEAQARAYQAVDRINWPEGFCRRDIGWQAVEAEKAQG